MTAWNYHQDVAESWDELESSQLGSKVTIEGKAFLERPFVVRHREGLVFHNKIGCAMFKYVIVVILLMTDRFDGYEPR